MAETEDEIMEWLYLELDCVMDEIMERLGRRDIDEAKKLLVEAARNVA